jgi:hypothetical protein
MSVFETYSKRQKRLANAGKQDVYQYDDLPNAFRVQVIHIWRSAIGRYYNQHGNATAATEVWDGIHSVLAREYGVFVLSRSSSSASTQSAVCENFLLEADTAGVLDIVELSFIAINGLVRQWGPDQRYSAGVSQTPNDAIEELNVRFREHGLGYQFLGGKLVRVDSQFLHAEVLKPALGLLNSGGFDGPADEFIHAFEHYRHGSYKEAVVEALKAFESTMKAICESREWPYPATATAKQLMEVLFNNGLVPPMLECHFTNLRVAMESGLPTVRNKTSGHGQGATPIQIPAHFAAYALHLAATNIVFLVEAHKAFP